MTTTYWDKFVLLMWKNWLLQWRHKLQSVIEIFVPVLFSALLVLIRSLVDPTIYDKSVIYNPLKLGNLDHVRHSIKEKHLDFKAFLLKRDTNFSRLSKVDYRLAYSPKNDLLGNLTEKAKNFLNLDGLIPMENSSILGNYLMSNNTIAGVEFPDSYKNLTELPNNLIYSIRFPSELRTGGNNPLILNWKTDLLFPIFQTGGPRNPEADDGGVPAGYYREGFLCIQNAINKFFIEMKLNLDESDSTIGTDFNVQRFPYPPYTLDLLLQGLEGFVSLVILLSFVYPCINLVKFIATEKEKQLKESMKIMGLPNWLHWTAWFIKAIIFMMISISFIVGLLKVSTNEKVYVAVFTYSDWSAVWMFLFVYSVTTISFCFMMSVFFSRANTATAVTGLSWFLIYSPFTFTEQNYSLLTLHQKLLVSLFSNTAMGYGFQLIVKHEGTGMGLQWDNIWSPVTPDDNLSVGLIIIMLLVDAIIYFTLALYVEKIKPGDFGVAEKWYFPFTKSFWCGPSEYKGISDVHMNNHVQDNIENEPTDKYAGVQVKDLKKIYSNKKVAVKGLSVNMFEDQITVLLGHNGAGKTTTMSMLTGMFPPTSGTAIINGKDIKTDIQGVRTSLGLCPQHNVLFDELTVREHIIFYSKLKGLDKSEIEKEVTKYVDLLELQPKINSPAKTLSGGMQRKLSVGIALCGNSKVVLCDEPTSGMDPAARRSLWDLLQKEKKGRTILLSTHFMDEADILGDRIAIMSDGELKACGSSFFLKKKYGVGYHLICVKGNNCSILETTNLLRKYIPDIEVETDIGSELSYQLSETYADNFEKMLSEIEDNSMKLGILGYGISLTTLEEVFMRIGTDSTNKIVLDMNKIQNNEKLLEDPTKEKNGSALTINTDNNRIHLLTGAELIGNQIRAMFEKKILYTLRNWLMFLIQIIIPICFIIMTILIVQTWAGGRDLPPYHISFSSYKTAVTVLQVDYDEFTSNSSINKKIADEYVNLFKTSESYILKTTTENIDSYLLKLSRLILPEINQKYLIGATITEDNITIRYNNQPFHTSPLSLNVLYNAILAAHGCKNCSVEVYNKPLPFTTQSRLDMLQAGNNMGFQLSFNCGFALAFVSAFYVLFYIKERISRAKLLQIVSGINIIVFWITAFIWDFITFVITSVCTISVLAMFQEDGWSTADELGRVFVIWMCFGFAVIPVSYLLSMLFTIPSTGFVRIAIFNIFTGVALFLIVFIMKFDNFDLKDIADSLTWVLLAFPHFALSEGLNNLNIVNIVLRTCGRCTPPFCDPQTLCDIIPLCCERNYFQWNSPGVGRNIFYMMIVGIVALLILMIKEQRLLDFAFYTTSDFGKKAPPDDGDELIDDDVLAEKKRIDKMSPLEIKKTNLVLRNVSKYYKNFLAVNKLSVAVNDAECFGLLGINGAGKTSTFKMMTGDENISYGEAWVKGISLKTNMTRVHQQIGYCPQFDALIEDLTGREILRMFCLIRGVKHTNINSLSLKLANELNFIKHIDKKVSEYSGGNKRKLSTAVALIGNPSVVYLDEPTTGMDPGAKRQLWNMICKIRESGKTIILTSHSMEECEALCTKLAIMVNGEFKCIGSTQYLKNKFSKGYILTVKIKKLDNQNEPVSQNDLMNNISKLKTYISDNFPGAYLREEYKELLTYYIPETNQKWSRMFGIMQSAKSILNIEDYSLSQTSLEQVFLSFAQHQKDENLSL